jgi:SNF2 family DNA or RNA helicase
MSPLKKFGFAWVTLGFLVVSFIGHWLFGWFAFVNEQQSLGQPVETGPYVIEMLRDTLENWQSEFLQLLWQVVGLTVLLYVGSPQSKEAEDRTEEILKEIIRKVEPKEAEKFLAELEQKFPSK